eukprot:GDKI01035447.1.p1 GENE.GDKI01035447.1~~GDKI01035447.1.p1  ORF type:complete len:489 (+),score=135.57 GDKI01035447.1:172-1467(+)
MLPGGYEYDGLRKFRDRMYWVYGIHTPPTRTHTSNEHHPVLYAAIIGNKRYSPESILEMQHAMHMINEWKHNAQVREHMVHTHGYVVSVEWIEWGDVKYDTEFLHTLPTHMGGNVTEGVSDEVTRSPIMLSPTNAHLSPHTPSSPGRMPSKFRRHLEIMSRIDILISAPGTGSMYQTFMQDGSVYVNLGGVHAHSDTHKHASYLEQYMAGGCPYIRALYYPYSARVAGIRGHVVWGGVHLAARTLMDGFVMPVDQWSTPLESNLSIDAWVFRDYCRLQPEGCAFLDHRPHLQPGEDTEAHLQPGGNIEEHIYSTNWCTWGFWGEDFVHEGAQYSEAGHPSNRITCTVVNRYLLRALRAHYGIESGLNRTRAEWMQMAEHITGRGWDTRDIVRRAMQVPDGVPYTRTQFLEQLQTQTNHPPDEFELMWDGTQ